MDNNNQIKLISSPLGGIFQAGSPVSRASFRRQGGFTLVEILLVIGLIAILATVLLQSTGGLFSSGQEEVARLWVNKTARTALEAYRLHMREYPSTEEGLKALVAPPRGKEANWKGPYLDDEPMDPWQQPYHYAFPGRHNPRSYDIWSTGPSKRDGGEDNIGNWKSPKR